MRIHPIPITILLCFYSIISFSQKNDNYNLRLRDGDISTEKNITPDNLKVFTNRLQKVNGKSFAILQFEQLPTETVKKQLAAAGIQLLEYIPKNAYTICITKNLDAPVLLSARVRSVIELSPQQKMHPLMAKGIFPSWAIKSANMVDVWISFPKTISFDEIKNLLLERSVEINSTKYSQYNIIGLRIARQRLNEVASFPFIEYLEPAPHGDQLLNYESRNDSKANLLNAGTSVGGYNLKGSGVVIGVGDDADPQYHIDFNGRLINFSDPTIRYHGTHVNGTVGGAGNKNELYTGYAPKSTLIAQATSGIISNAPDYVNEFGMVLTNNSYGDIVGDCLYMGYYDLQSRILDQMAISFPNLQNIYAAGNDGQLNCSPYPSSFGTVLSGYQSAKNVLTVGATDRGGAIATFSSRGPVKDGRTKPEITADGLYTISTVPDNTYGYGAGTSMAAPAVTGGAALLYERYRALKGSTPKNGLIKALLCNGSNDRGNIGPDYTNGFGYMNLLRSIDMLNNDHYFISTINNGGVNTHTISIPANTSQLKVMIYWNDPAAAVFSTQTLINDLDLNITTSTAVTVLPFKLDTLAANVDNQATNSADHINNIEQVVIDNPANGTYTITVNGNNVPWGPQEYFIVYDIIPVQTKITHPIGGEMLQPGETSMIQWESFGDPANNFTVEYSTDNGANWVTINNNVPSSSRSLSWVIPSTVTNQALVRVSRNGTALLSSSSVFTILEAPMVNLSAIQCEGYFSFNWTPIPGATDYEIFQLQGSEMVSIGTTTSTSYSIRGLSSGQEYWIAVSARINGVRGRRSEAIKRIPNSGSCVGTISDNDLKLDSIVAPVYGRISTSTSLTSSTPVIARIKNLDDASITNFKMRYFVGGLLIVEDIVSATVLPQATYTHTFSVPYNFSLAGNYILKIEVENITGIDPVSSNNSIIDTIRQLNNNPISLPFIDNLESATPRQYFKSKFGIEGIDRYDFTNTDPFGRFSTFLTNGMAYSGSKSLIMDYAAWNGGIGSNNFIYGTYNLNGVNAAIRDIRLDFQFKSHGDSVISPVNKVWIRGDDTKPWVEAFTLSSNGNIPGVFKRTPSLEISDLLIAASQNFSSSFQVRFGQFGIVHIVDNRQSQGHNFDDIRIYEAIDDIQLKSIDGQQTSNCSLSSSTPLKITVRNASSNSISNIPVRMVVDGGLPVTETIAGPLGPNASMQYTLTNTANLSALGNHTILINVQYGTDNFRDNDTLSLDVFNSPLISTFPHLENFETNNGYWHSSGVINSWEYGIPASPKINKAASGTKAWKTNLTGNYNGLETSYLYSPCYNIGGMTNPTLSLNIALDLEDCGGTLCDGAYIEYSTDGLTWARLGDVGTGTNWYNKNYAGNKLWSVQNYTRWHVVTTPLPTVPIIRFRVVLESDLYVNLEGVAIDDVHVYDNTMGIYNGVTMSSPVSQNIPGGANWINFTSGGKLVASVNPNNQSLGNTNVQTYINTGGIGSDERQYYHDRSITIKPTNTVLTDSVTVRFYFLDSETENLLNASGCSACTKPSMVTELGVTKYSDPDDNFENGNLADDIQGAFSFLSADWNYKIPFDKGYYIEFKTKDFSEFWLNNGGASKQLPLRAELISFTATKNNTDVLVEWKTGYEKNIDHFEIEVAKGDIAFQNGQFIKIGEIVSPGVSNSERNYSFNDTEPGKVEIRYYRLKIVNKDNSFIYSPVRSISFNEDIQLESIDEPIAANCSLSNLTQVKVRIRNTSSSSISNIPVRMVVDGGLPVTETIAGPLGPNASMQYTLTNTANLSALGNHTILINVQYATDDFKDNDTLTLNVFNAPLISIFPHVENFEINNGYWHSSGVINSWEYGTPASPKINKAASGTKAWKTNLTGNYSGLETSYLYSPCYNIAGMTTPTLSLNIALDLEDCGGTLCDGAYIEYSTDGIAWARLGDVGTGTNWYNKNYGGNKLWNAQEYTRWHVVTTLLPTVPTIRFRIALLSNSLINREGIAIDDVHVYDNTMGIYNGVTMNSPVSQNISGGTNWINFVSGGKLVASVNPNSQSLGNTNLQAYINTGGIRSDERQYYHDRSITIKPANTTVTDSVRIRFYFLDSETENLLNASGCSTCTKPSMVTELGVTKYSDPDDNFENGTLADDIQGEFSFLSADWNYKIPFDKGYYIEFKTKDFSEFWLNNGGVNRQLPLRAELISFTATKNNTDVLVEWKTGYEKNIDHFEIEVARGDNAFQNGQFFKIGEIASAGVSNSERSYSFNDTESGKVEIRYYRLKIVNKDNSFIYSPVRSVIFNENIHWQVFPNPSSGNYEFMFKIDQAKPLDIKIYDISGRLVKQIKFVGNGLQQKLPIDLKSEKFQRGVYLLLAESGEKKYNVRLVKQ